MSIVYYTQKLSYWIVHRVSNRIDASFVMIPMREILRLPDLRFISHIKSRSTTSAGLSTYDPWLQTHRQMPWTDNRRAQTTYRHKVNYLPRFPVDKNVKLFSHLIRKIRYICICTLTDPMIGSKTSVHKVFSIIRKEKKYKYVNFCSSLQSIKRSSLLSATAVFLFSWFSVDMEIISINVLLSRGLFLVDIDLLVEIIPNSSAKASCQNNAPLLHQCCHAINND